MAKFRDRRYHSGSGGGLDLGGLLNAIVGGGENSVGEVEQVPNIPPQGPTQEGGYLQPEPSQFRVKAKSNDRSQEGRQLANEANIRSIQSEEQRKSGIRTKQAEIPIDVQKETALNVPRLELHKALGTQTLQQELDRRSKMDPLDIEKERQEHIMTLVTSQGMQATPKNIADADALLSGINLSKNAQQETEAIAKSRLGTSEAETANEISERNRDLNVNTGGQAAQLSNITTKGNLEAQPLFQEQRMKMIPDMAKNAYYEELRKRLFPLSKDESVADIGTGKIAFRSPSKFETDSTTGKLTLSSQTGIQPKTGNYGSPALGNVTPQSNLTSTNTSPDMVSDPNNPNNMIITTPSGKKISVPKQ